MATKYKEIVVELNQALQENNIDVFLSYCAEDVSWTMTGDVSMVGKEAVTAFLAPMKGTTPGSITLAYTIEEGNMVASSGNMRMPDGKTEIAFADFYIFEGEKIKEITSYIIEFKDGKKANAN